MVRRIFLRKMRLHRTGCRSSPRKVTLGSAARLQAPSLTPRCRYQLFAVEGHCSLGIYFVTLTQTCGAHFAHRRFFLFFLLKFCARACSGYLFRQRFPAAGCRTQIANFMLMRFAIFLARAFSRHRLYYTSCGVFFLIEENPLKAGETFKGFFP